MKCDVKVTFAISAVTSFHPSASPFPVLTVSRNNAPLIISKLYIKGNIYLLPGLGMVTERNEAKNFGQGTNKNQHRLELHLQNGCLERKLCPPVCMVFVLIDCRYRKWEAVL